MSVPAISHVPIPLSPASKRREAKISDRNITTIIVFGSAASMVMLIASAILLQFSLLIGAFSMLGLTALSAIFAHRHNIRYISKEFQRATHFLQEEIEELKNEVNELKKNQITPSSLMERLAVLEKEFLNRGRYKYIDETPGEDDVPLPSAAASSALPARLSSMPSEQLPK
jgi:hypothetical protein